jgi:hypothetical protein
MQTYCVDSSGFPLISYRALRRHTALDASRHVEHDFADCAAFHSLVHLPRRLKGEMGVGEMAHLPPCQEMRDLLHGGVLGHFRRVIEPQDPDGGVTGTKLQRDRWRGRDGGHRDKG